VEGQKLYSDIRIEHRKIKAPASGRNLKIIEAEIEKGKTLSPRMRFYYARELMFNGRGEKAIAAFEEYLQSGEGWCENQVSAARDLSFCYEREGKDKMALKSALWGLSFSLPRAELLCRIGELFLKEKRFAEAKYWYERALDCVFPQNSLGFVEKDYYGYIPALQLCVICHALKEYGQAQSYNEKAGSFKPHSPQYLYNKKYYENWKRN
jgi:tetratricopeptide (TPR) repeat protein